jgi:peptide/nickel transport system permease protein
LRRSEYVIRRVGLTLFVLIGLTVIAFTLARVLPADPAALYVGPRARPEQIANARVLLGLNKPLYIQYLIYLEQLFHGDFGLSIRTKQPVLSDVLSVLPASLELITVSMLIAVAIGLPLGILSASRKDTITDHITRVVTVGGVSIPAFWLGLLIQVLFFRWLRVLPIGGRIDPTLALTNPIQQITGFYLIDSLLTGNWAGFSSSFAHIVLPALTLAAYSIGLIARMTRSSMLEVLGENYIRTARAWGFPNRIINYVYALKNAIGPTLTVIGLSFAYLLTGTFYVEVIFDWPGLGTYAGFALFSLDYPVIMAITLILGFAYVMINLLLDVLQTYLDPRVTMD